MIDIIDIPLFALFSLFLYLGPSEFYTIHVIHLVKFDFDNKYLI